MNKFECFLAKKAYIALSFFPQKLPKGANEFVAYCDKLLWAYDLPDMKSYREAVATMVLHLGPTVHKKAPHYFVRSIKKAMSNQVAFSYLEQLRADRKLEDKKETEELAKHSAGTSVHESLQQA